MPHTPISSAPQQRDAASLGRALDALVGRIPRLRRRIRLAFTIGLVGRRRLISGRRVGERRARRLAGEPGGARVLATAEEAKQAAFIAKLGRAQQLTFGPGGLRYLAARTGRA